MSPVDYRAYGKTPEELAEQGRRKIQRAGVSIIAVNALFFFAAYELGKLFEHLKTLDGSLLKLSACAAIAGAVCGGWMIAQKKRCRLIYAAAAVCAFAALLSLVLGALPVRLLDASAWAELSEDTSEQMILALLGELGSSLLMSLLFVLAAVYVWPYALAGHYIFGRVEVKTFLEREEPGDETDMYM